MEGVAQVQGHTAVKWQSENFISGLLNPKTLCKVSVICPSDVKQDVEPPLPS